MTDKKTLAVINMLSEQVGYSFKVVKIRHLLDSLPRKYAMDENALWTAISMLKEADYAVVKYRDKEEICLALTVKAENLLRARPAQKHDRPWLLAGVFVASFLGALLAVLLGKLF